MAPNQYHRWSTQAHHRLAVELLREGRLRDGPAGQGRVGQEEVLGVWKMLAEAPEEHLGVVVYWDR